MEMLESRRMLAVGPDPMFGAGGIVTTAFGNGEDSAPVHNPAYNFNDAAIPYGAGILAAVVEKELPKPA